LRPAAQLELLDDGGEDGEADASESERGGDR
jgi:hypothetical protein